MTIFFILNHPAHFHLFKNTLKSLKESNNNIHIFIRPKDVLEELLISQGFEYEIISSINYKRTGKFSIITSSIMGLLIKDLKLAQKVRKYKPDLLIGTDWSIVHVGKLFGIPSIVFNEDDTIATPENKLFYPLASTLVMPSVCDKNKWLKKRVSYNGYHELAYLHPRYFNPSRDIVKNELKNNKPYIIIRLVKLSASHDLGKKGISKQSLIQIINKYNNKYNFLISSEEENLGELDIYSYKFNASLMHHFLGFASLVIGDSQTTIAEAAVLGTPSLRFNDFVGKLSYLEELEHKYELTYGFKTTEFIKLREKIDELLAYPNLIEEWQKRRQKMLSEKIDVTAFMIWFIENYPKSTQIVRRNPDFQYAFN